MKQSRFIPYGYTMRNGKTIIEHSEADIIKEIFKEYISGASLKDIAESLTARKCLIPKKQMYGIKLELQELLTIQNT